MALKIGSGNVSYVYLGRNPVDAIYSGKKKVWSRFTFYHDFMQGADGWTSEPGVAVNSSGQLAANSSSTTTSNTWLNYNATSGNSFYSKVRLGDVTDPVQKTTFLFGTPSRHFYYSISQNATLIGYYDGSSWRDCGSSGSINLRSYDMVEIFGSSSYLSMTVNGSTVVSGTPAGGLGDGIRVGIVNRSYSGGWLSKYYSPNVKSVGVI